MGQPLTDEQRFQELQQRINEKAESLIKWGTTEGRKRRWIIITIWTVLIAIIVAVEVYSYVQNEFLDLNISVGVFIATFFIADRIMVMIMRHYLTRMKSSTTALQHFRPLKRLITTHKLRQVIPLTVAVTCMVIGVFLGSLMRNWFLDDDFCFDVEELADMINQDSAT